VHEAYLRLTDKTDVGWESRRHFFIPAGRARRDILVAPARRTAGPAHRVGVPPRAPAGTRPPPIPG
jgi:hypothetical protein